MWVQVHVLGQLQIQAKIFPEHKRQPSIVLSDLLQGSMRFLCCMVSYTPMAEVRSVYIPPHMKLWWEGRLKWVSCHEVLYQHRWLFNWPSGRDCLYYCVCYLWIITNYTLLSPQWSVICLIWLVYSELKDALLTGARQLTPSSALWAAWLACLAYLRQFWKRSCNHHAQCELTEDLLWPNAGSECSWLSCHRYMQ